MTTEQRNKINQEVSSHYDYYITTAMHGRRKWHLGRGVVESTIRDEAEECVMMVLASWLEKSNDKVQTIIDNPAGSNKNYIAGACTIMSTKTNSPFNYKSKVDENSVCIHNEDEDSYTGTDDQISLSTDSNYIEEALDPELLVATKRAIDTLEGNAYRYYVASLIQAYSHQEIADDYGVSKSTVTLSIKNSTEIVRNHITTNYIKH